MSMSTKKGILIICIVIVFSLALSACGDLMGAAGGKAKSAGWKDKDIDDLMAIIDAASILEPLTPKDEIEVLGNSTDGTYEYTQEKHNVIENRESILYMGLNDDVLFPGAIIEGTNVYDFVYKPIITTRAPITLSLSLESTPTTGDSITITVDDPSKLSNVRQGINDLLKGAITPETTVPAQWSLETHQVYSSEEMNLRIGVSGSYADVSMDFDFNWRSETKKNKIMSVYKQVYYTVDINIPPAPYDFFDPSLGVDGVAAALPAVSMPMYVSSVSYGWMAVLFIETDYTKEEMDTALRVAYDSEVAKGEFELDYHTRNVLESSSIYILVYGGSTAGITKSTLEGYSGLFELIDGSKDFGPDSPGVPLSYKLRHLSNNLIAKIALTEEYTITKHKKVREFIRITLDKFECMKADDEGLDDTVDMDRFSAWVRAFREDTPIRHVNLLEWSTSGEVPMSAGENRDWYPPADPFPSTVIKFNLKKAPLKSHFIELNAYARDWDGCCNSPESGEGSKVLEYPDYFNPTKSYVEILSPDFKFWAWFTIEPATAAEYCAIEAVKDKAFCTKYFP